MKNILSLFLIILVIGCNNKQWQTAEIKPNISDSKTFKKLDTLNDVSTLNSEKLKPKTSGVKYYHGSEKNPEAEKFSTDYNCEAFFINNVLNIRLGIDYANLGGNGILIEYKNSKFNSEPYFWTDNISNEDSEPVYKNIFQELTLNDSSYKEGDSIFGHINLKTLEIKKDSDTIIHNAKGFFRAKISSNKQRS